jgi:N-acetylglucosamine kinase-like BadF-type ATPase
MTFLLAADAGGTSTRAVALDKAGRALGYGRAGAGNPTAAGTGEAVDAIVRACELALTGARPGGAVDHCTTASIAHAGERTADFRDQVSTRLSALGCRQVDLRHDLLGMFHSGTPAPDGYVLVGGTGTIAGRVVRGRLESVVGGHGWLLGDAGGGYWIGHRVARAVIASLDGQAAPTALTGLLLDAVGVRADPSTTTGRRDAAKQLVSALYARRPASLAAFAPLAFAAHEDPVAREILVSASTALESLVAAVRVPDLPGPLVVGGSVVVRGLLEAPADLRRELTPLADVEPIRVCDGLVGAAVMGMQAAGIAVDETLFSTLRAEITGAANGA